MAMPDGSIIYVPLFAVHLKIYKMSSAQSDTKVARVAGWVYPEGTLSNWLYSRWGIQKAVILKLSPGLSPPRSRCLYQLSITPVLRMNLAPHSVPWLSVKTPSLEFPPCAPVLSLRKELEIALSNCSFRRDDWGDHWLLEIGLRGGE